mmetsp:Transcript_12373/g.29400  ORF Transcript_12373/g.29400 Transcript_12373/m.29400 type:complete len:301 (+) Transcript_12373:1084-1986(+)
MHRLLRPSGLEDVLELWVRAAIDNRVGDGKRRRVRVLRVVPGQGLPLVDTHSPVALGLVTLGAVHVQRFVGVEERNRVDVACRGAVAKVCPIGRDGLGPQGLVLSGSCDRCVDPDPILLHGLLLHRSQIERLAEIIIAVFEPRWAKVLLRRPWTVLGIAVSGGSRKAVQLLVRGPVVILLKQKSAGAVHVAERNLEVPVLPVTSPLALRSGILQGEQRRGRPQRRLWRLGSVLVQIDAFALFDDGIQKQKVRLVVVPCVLPCLCALASAPRLPLFRFGDRIQRLVYEPVQVFNLAAVHAC